MSNVFHNFLQSKGNIS